MDFEIYLDFKKSQIIDGRKVIGPKPVEFTASSINEAISLFPQLLNEYFTGNDINLFSKAELMYVTQLSKDSFRAEEIMQLNVAFLAKMNNEQVKRLSNG